MIVQMGNPCTYDTFLFEERKKQRHNDNGTKHAGLVGLLLCNSSYLLFTFFHLRAISSLILVLATAIVFFLRTLSNFVSYILLCCDLFSSIKLTSTSDKSIEGPGRNKK